MTKKQAGFMAAVAGALVLVGAACDPGDAEQATGPDPDAELPVASVVFASSFSRHGRFQVSQSPDGRLAVAITGRAGDDDPETIARAVGTKSLIAMHRALHPGATSVPPQSASARGALRPAVRRVGSAGRAPVATRRKPW